MSSAAYQPLGTEDPDRRTVSSLSADRVVMQKQGRRPSHTTVVVLHLAFKIIALVVYIFGSLVSKSFIGVFITIMLLLSADFWIVKNVSGRLLAGLRWWSTVNDDGKVKWIYESWTEEERQLAQITKSGEANLFWVSLITCQLFWLLFAISAMVSFNLKWVLLCALSLVLNGANLLGYIKCRMGKVTVREKMAAWATRVILRKKSEPEGGN